MKPHLKMYEKYTNFELMMSIRFRGTFTILPRVYSCKNVQRTYHLLDVFYCHFKCDREERYGVACGVVSGVASVIGPAGVSDIAVSIGPVVPVGIGVAGGTVGSVGTSVAVGASVVIVGKVVSVGIGVAGGLVGMGVTVLVGGTGEKVHVGSGGGSDSRSRVGVKKIDMTDVDVGVNDGGGV